MNFREWPLVLFTLLLQTAAGAAAVFSLSAAVVGQGGRSSRPGAALLVFIPAAFAAAFSLFHLGRPGRAPRSIRNFGQSWLSREIVLLLTFEAAAAGLAISEAAEIGAAGIFGPLAAVSGFACVYAMSRIYMLPAVPDWNSWRTPAAFFSSAFVLGGLAAGTLDGRWKMAVLALCGAAFLFNVFFAPRFGLFVRRSTPMGFRPNRAWPGIFAVRLGILAAAILVSALGLIIPAAAAWLDIAALAAAILSEFIGRLQFYDLPLGLSPRKG